MIDFIRLFTALKLTLVSFILIILFCTLVLFLLSHFGFLAAVGIPAFFIVATAIYYGLGK